MRKVEAVILDWAGTAVDYGCFAPVQAFAESFRDFHLNPTIDEIRKPMGMLKREHIKTVLSMQSVAEQFNAYYGRPFSEEDVDEINHIFESKLLGILHNYAVPKPYVLETVASLRKIDIKIGSTTGYTDEMMEIVVKEAEKKGYNPDAWFSPNAVGNIGRPYPYMIFKNMEALRLKSVQAILKVGDTVSDILEGKNAGAVTAGVIEGSSEMGLTQAEYEELEEKEKEQLCAEIEARYLEAGADYVIRDIRGVLELISHL